MDEFETFRERSMSAGVIKLNYHQARRRSSSPMTDVFRRRSRTSSMPACRLQEQVVGWSEDFFYTRARSFSTTSKGVIKNCGDSVRLASQSSLDSAFTEINSKSSRRSSVSRTLSSTATSQLVPSFKVIVMGFQDVGKTTLIGHFMTSEDISEDEIDEAELEYERTLSVTIDGEECLLNFHDSTSEGVIEGVESSDAIILVYSVTDTKSFSYALKVMKEMQPNRFTPPIPLILVANKMDVVRKRVITQQKGRKAAMENDCKYIETSATLKFNVDELLVGLVKQIRSAENERSGLTSGTRPRRHSSKGHVTRAAKIVLSKLVGKSGKLFRSCDSLDVMKE